MPEEAKEYVSTFYIAASGNHTWHRVAALRFERQQHLVLDLNLAVRPVHEFVSASSVAAASDFHALHGSSWLM